MNKNQFDDLLKSEDIHMQKLHQIVLDSLKEEKLIASKIYQKDETLSRADKLSDKVAEFGGSWKFIIAFFSMMLLWILLNVYWLQDKGFDPYPFILLNLILSCLASIQHEDYS